MRFVAFNDVVFRAPQMKCSLSFYFDAVRRFSPFFLRFIACLIVIDAAVCSSSGNLAWRSFIAMEFLRALNSSASSFFFRRISAFYCAARSNYCSNYNLKIVALWRSFGMVSVHWNLFFFVTFFVWLWFMHKHKCAIWNSCLRLWCVFNYHRLVCNCSSWRLKIKYVCYCHARS